MRINTNGSIYHMRNYFICFPKYILTQKAILFNDNEDVDKIL